MTPKRHFYPGAWSREGHAVPVPRCLGACSLYGRPCTCTDTELANAVPPDDTRTFAPRRPRLSPMQRALAAAVGSMVAFALILLCFPN